MKKILLSLGTMASVVAPIAAVVACSEEGALIVINEKTQLEVNHFILKHLGVQAANLDYANVALNTIKIGEKYTLTITKSDSADAPVEIPFNFVHPTGQSSTDLILANGETFSIDINLDESRQIIVSTSKIQLSGSTTDSKNGIYEIETIKLTDLLNKLDAIKPQLDSVRGLDVSSTKIYTDGFLIRSFLARFLDEAGDKSDTFISDLTSIQKIKISSRINFSREKQSFSFEIEILNGPSKLLTFIDKDKKNHTLATGHKMILELEGTYSGVDRFLTTTIEKHNVKFNGKDFSVMPKAAEKISANILEILKENLRKSELLTVYFS